MAAKLHKTNSELFKIVAITLKNLGNGLEGKDSKEFVKFVSFFTDFKALTYKKLF